MYICIYAECLTQMIAQVDASFDLGRPFQHHHHDHHCRRHHHHHHHCHHHDQMITGRCEFGSRPPLSQFVLQQSATLALPVLLLILVTINFNMDLLALFKVASPTSNSGNHHLAYKITLLSQSYFLF